MTIALLGVVLALSAVIVYLTRKWTTVQMEKATLENSKMASGSKIEVLQRAALQEEANRRKLENDIENDDDRPTEPFYLVRPDKDDRN